MSRQALIIVDVQQGFDDPGWGARNNPECEANIAKLVDRWELVGQPVVVVRHDSIEPQSPLRPDRPGNALKDFLRGRGDVLISKSVHSAFHGEPDLDGWLRAHDVTRWRSPGSPPTTAARPPPGWPADLGYQVCFVGDATATFDRTSPSGKLISADRVGRDDVDQPERRVRRDQRHAIGCCSGCTQPAERCSSRTQPGVGGQTTATGSRAVSAGCNGGRDSVGLAKKFGRIVEVRRVEAAMEGRRGAGRQRGVHPGPVRGHRTSPLRSRSTWGRPRDRRG